MELVYTNALGDAGQTLNGDIFEFYTFGVKYVLNYSESISKKKIQNFFDFSISYHILTKNSFFAILDQKEFLSNKNFAHDFKHFIKNF